MTITHEGYVKRLPAEHLPRRRAAAGEGIRGGDAKDERLHRARVRRLHARRPAVLHGHRSRVQDEGLRDPRDAADRARAVDREPDRPPPGRDGRELHADLGLREGRVLPGLRDGPGARQAHQPQAVPERQPERHHRGRSARRRLAHRRRRGPMGTTTCSSARAAAWPSASARATHARWGGTRPA